ncbi:MAG: GDSL-type esterase/lipase family protein [Fibromonadales bacterium]|nr:GDSL-type esterase/lipase family protein [Fibromonadales bacterium]
MKLFLKFSIVLAMFLALLVTGCSDGGDDYNGKTIVCFGNSLTIGYGAGDSINPIDESKSYPAYLEKKVNIPVVNLGKNGLSAEQAVDSIKKHRRELNSAEIVIIELGANDLIDRVLASFFNAGIDYDFVEEKVERSFEAILDYIESLGGKHKIYLAKFYNEEVADDLFDYFPEFKFAYKKYEDMFERLKEKYNVEIIDNIWDGVWGEHMYDLIHPNAKGYEIMTDNYFKAMKNFLEENNLLKIFI